MKWEAWAIAPRVTKFRYADGVEEVALVSKDGPAPACVTLALDLEGGSGLMTFYLDVDQADQLAAKVAAAVAAARTMPVEERVHQLGQTKAQVDQTVEERMRGDR